MRWFAPTLSTLSQANKAGFKIGLKLSLLRYILRCHLERPIRQLSIDNSGTAMGFGMNKPENKSGIIHPFTFIDQKVTQVVDSIGIVLSDSTIESDASMNLAWFRTLVS
jgi:hypothetical protein